MDLSHVILGPVVTEKAERLKAARAHTIRVAPQATKVEIVSALERFYDVAVANVRIIAVKAKSRPLTQGSTMEKRHAYKKAIVTLAAKSKALDLASFKTVS